MLKFKKGDEVIVTGFINALTEEYGTLGEVGVVEVVDDSEIPYFVKLESVKGGSGGLWFKEENLKSAKGSTFYKGVVYSVGDVIERLDDCPYPIGSKHTIIAIGSGGVYAKDAEGSVGFHCLSFVKKVNDINKSQLLKQEIEVGDIVIVISLENTIREYGANESMKKVEESFIVKDVCKYEKDDLIEVFDEGNWSYDSRDLVILQKASDMKERKLAPIDLKLHTHTSFDASTTGEDDYFGDFDISPDDLKGMVDDMISHPIQPIESDGGSSDYYFTKLPKWLIDQIVETGGIEVKDIVQFVFDNDAHAKDIIKAQKRIIEQRKGGGKAGLKPLYDYNKIVFFAEDQLRVAKNNLDEKSE
ncbi:DNA polymerase [Acinetobacter phage vB_AbaM_B9]|nr:DNA polymerase [Acinetobacter phage vB_AbaM_B9]